MSQEHDIAAIAAGLTKAQREALLHPNAGESSYRWTRIGTLNALYSRALVQRHVGPGSFYSPQTAIKWPLTPLGKDVRAHLEGKEP